MIGVVKIRFLKKEKPELMKESLQSFVVNQSVLTAMTDNFRINF